MRMHQTYTIDKEMKPGSDRYEIMKQNEVASIIKEKVREVVAKWVKANSWGCQGLMLETCIYTSALDIFIFSTTQRAGYLAGTISKCFCRR